MISEGCPEDALSDEQAAKRASTAERSQTHAKVHEAFDFNAFLYAFLKREKSFNPSADVRKSLIISRKMAEGFENQILQTLQPSSQTFQYGFKTQQPVPTPAPKELPPPVPGFRRTIRRFENPVPGFRFSKPGTEKSTRRLRHAEGLKKQILQPYLC